MIDEKAALLAEDFDAAVRKRLPCEAGDIVRALLSVFEGVICACPQDRLRAAAENSKLCVDEIVSNQLCDRDAPPESRH